MCIRDRPKCRGAPPWRPIPETLLMFNPYNSQIDMDKGIRAKKPEPYNPDRRGPRIFPKKKGGYKPPDGKVKNNARVYVAESQPRDFEVNEEVEYGDGRYEEEHSHPQDRIENENF